MLHTYIKYFVYLVLVLKCKVSDKNQTLIQAIRTKKKHYAVPYYVSGE